MTSFSHASGSSIPVVELNTTMRGVEYLLPRGSRTGRACGGLFLVVFGLFFLTPPTVIVLALSINGDLGKEEWWAYLFTIPFFLVGGGAVLFGLLAWFGRTWTFIEDDAVVVRFGLPFLRFTRRHPTGSVRAVTLAPSPLRTGTGLADIRLTLANGKQVAVAEQYDPATIRPMAEDLAMRCQLMLDDRTRGYVEDPAVGQFSARARSGGVVGTGAPAHGRPANVVLSAPAGSGGPWALLFAAIFWNGISWTIAVVMWFTVKDAWCPMMFISLFCAIGILLIYGVVTKFMAAARMHEPIVRISYQPLYLGEAFTCWIEQQAKRQVTITCLVVKLICRESATYRRGTSTTTVTHDVYSNAITTAENETIDVGRPLSAELNFQIPPDSMHTFDASHNKIQWLLDVRTQIPRWPDYTAQVMVHVAPKRCGLPAPGDATGPAGAGPRGSMS